MLVGARSTDVVSMVVMMLLLHAPVIQIHVSLTLHPLPMFV